MMINTMQSVISDGLGKDAALDNYKYTAGKTGSTEVPNSYGFGTKDQWIVGYTPDIVVATWVGFDRTSRQHYMQGISETGITRLYKAEMEGILPYTAQTQFTEKAPNQIVKDNGSNFDWTGGLGQKIQDGIGSAGQKINEWYNNVKGLFGQ